MTKVVGFLCGNCGETFTTDDVAGITVAVDGIGVSCPHCFSV